MPFPKQGYELGPPVFGYIFATKFCIRGIISSLYDLLLQQFPQKRARNCDFFCPNTKLLIWASSYCHIMIIISLFIWGKLLSISLMRICWWGIRCLTHCFLFSFTIGGQVQRWNIVCLTPMVLLENQVRGLYQVQAQQRLAKVAVINPKKTLQSKPFLILSAADTLMHFYGV